jgi:hypothetical protein
MRIKLLNLIFIMLIFGLFSCTFLTPKHETKSKADFYADKKVCDEKAWSYTQSLNIIDSDDAEGTQYMNYSRNCLKEKGWYYFE